MQIDFINWTSFIVKVNLLVVCPSVYNVFLLFSWSFDFSSHNFTEDKTADIKIIKSLRNKLGSMSQEKSIWVNFYGGKKINKRQSEYHWSCQNHFVFLVVATDFQ